MIPKKGSGGTIKYDFDSMKIGEDYILADNYDQARSIRVCAIARGFSACIRTVDFKIRVYLTEKRK